VFRAAIECVPPIGVAPIWHPPKLGRNHNLAAERCERFTKEQLIFEGAINFGSVEEGEAAFDSSMQ
jgi:hypothetical protein